MAKKVPIMPLTNLKSVFTKAAILFKKESKQQATALMKPLKKVNTEPKKSSQESLWA